MSTESITRIATYFRVCDGVPVRFADSKTDSDTTVLLLAPWPESLWAFRRIWAQVSGLGRVVAIEMPGFGHSDQTRAELIAPDASGEFLARLIDEWGLGSPHVVGPDVGTAAALFLAAKHPDCSRRSRRLRRSWPVATMNSCRGRITSTSTIFFPIARPIHSTPAISHGSKQLTSTVALSSTGSAAGIDA
jgi:pimeloyl-ACP methyl ester carboxylesterase